MKTFGLIWPDGRKELQSIVLDDEGNPRVDTLAPNPKPEDWQAPQIVPLVKIAQPEQGAWEPSLVWFDDRVERQWIAGTPAPPSAVQAEEWLSAQGYTPLRLLTCLDLEAKLAAANKTAPKLAAVRQWIDGITLLAAPDPDAARSDWPPAPWSFAEASGEALGGLQS